MSERREGKRGAVMRDIENELMEFDRSLSSDQSSTRRTSYYVEENEKLLNLLITNCEPILSQLTKQINHFNTYNKIHSVV